MDSAAVAQRIKEQAAEIHNATRNGTFNPEQVAAALTALDALAADLAQGYVEPKPAEQTLEQQVHAVEDRLEQMTGVDTHAARTP